MNRMWRENEINMLLFLIEQGADIEEIAEKLDRTENAVKTYARKHNIRIVTDGCRWTEDEIKEFTNDWKDADMTPGRLVKKYHRTWGGLRRKAYKLGLGKRPVSDIYLTVKQVAAEMNVQEYTVRRWIELGLRTKKSKTNKTTTHLIDADDLLVFLESHQKLFDASKISDILFYDEPDWLKNKRRYDFANYNKNRNTEWSLADDNRLVWLFSKGRTDEEISKEMHRSCSAIQAHRFILGLCRPQNYWSEYEISVLLKYHEYKTVSELHEMLPERTAAAISRKCALMNITYHESKSACLWSDEENTQLRQFMSEKKKVKEISEIMHRSMASIRRQKRYLRDLDAGVICVNDESERQE